MQVIQRGIAAPKGFLASGIHCGIKYRNKDLALLYSQVPAVACALLTQNKVQAAPVRVTQAHLKNSQAQAVLINSGNANCCTGVQGRRDAFRMSQAAAKGLDIKANDVLVASTGSIGQRLPVKKIEQKLGLLVKKLSAQGSTQAAQAIMTTDTRPKQIAVEVTIGKTKVRIGGIAKGAGMIAPHLATMLAFITTDAAIDSRKLNKALKIAVDNSFNSITVEGDTSTNDMVVILANGLAENKTITAKDTLIFQEALNFVCLNLAKMIVKDAEGATKFVELQVEGAKDLTQARQVAFKVANSALVKTAIFGGRPNWGRIAACVGAASQAIEQGKLSIYLGKIKVLHQGAALKINQQRLNRVFKKGQIQIKIQLGLGKCATRIFTCDLTNEYVKINARY